jgi:hypothetical protein
LFFHFHFQLQLAYQTLSAFSFQLLSGSLKLRFAFDSFCPRGLVFFWQTPGGGPVDTGAAGLVARWGNQTEVVFVRVVSEWWTHSHRENPWWRATGYCKQTPEMEAPPSALRSPAAS